MDFHLSREITFGPGHGKHPLGNREDQLSHGKPRMRWELKKVVLFLCASMLLSSCNLKYDSDILDLAFYQWNQWKDTEALYKKESLNTQSTELSQNVPNPPSCGWDVLHRGNGKLVRIPASLEGYSGVSWYHCRFTLPELWDKKQIALMFDDGGPKVEVYLNETLVGFHQGNHAPFEIDVTGKIYYTRDNHLAIRITDPDATGGIGIITVKSGEPLP